MGRAHSVALPALRNIDTRRMQGRQMLVQFGHDPKVAASELSRIAVINAPVSDVTIGLLRLAP